MARTNTDIFDNRRYKEERLKNFESMEVTAGLYNLIIGGVLLWGLLIVALITHFFGAFISNEINYIVLIILYFVMSFAGSFIVHKSKNPAISFLGFTILAAGMGMLLSVVLIYYPSSTIMTAFLITMIITGSMMVAGMLFPQFFFSIARVLFFALIVAVIASFVTALLGRNLIWLDYIIIVIFSGFIGFDWARAQQYPKNLDNAIDSAADIFIDVINIFIRVLSILGRKSND